MRKWHGASAPMKHQTTRSLLVYPGYLKVVVEAAMTVLTNEFTVHARVRSVVVDRDAIQRRIIQNHDAVRVHR